MSERATEYINLTKDAALGATTTSVKVGSAILSRARELSAYIKFADDSSQGVVVVETAHDINFAGTWANLTTVTWAAANRVHHVAITGVHLAIRFRPTTAVDGKGADVHFIAN